MDSPISNAILDSATSSSATARDSASESSLSPTRAVRSTKKQQQQKASDESGRSMMPKSAAKKNGLPLLFSYVVQLWHMYLWSLEYRPVIAKATTAAVISVISELLAQYLSGQWVKCNSMLTCINWIGVRNQLLIGFFIRGIPLHYWYSFLQYLFRNYDGSRTTSAQQQVEMSERKHQHADTDLDEAKLKKKKPSEPLWVAIAKVAVDQLTYGPLTNWLYFYVIGFMEGRTLAQIGALVDRDFLRLLIANWKVWPLISFITFKFVPIQLQVLFGNIISIFWTTYVVMNTRA